MSMIVPVLYWWVNNGNLLKLLTLLHVFCESEGRIHPQPVPPQKWKWKSPDFHESYILKACESTWGQAIALFALSGSTTESCMEIINGNWENIDGSLGLVSAWKSPGSCPAWDGNTHYLLLTPFKPFRDQCIPWKITGTKWPHVKLPVHLLDVVGIASDTITKPCYAGIMQVDYLAPNSASPVERGQVWDNTIYFRPYFHICTRKNNIVTPCSYPKESVFLFSLTPPPPSITFTISIPLRPHTLARGKLANGETRERRWRDAAWGNAQRTRRTRDSWQCFTPECIQGPTPPYRSWDVLGDGETGSCWPPYL